jgi:phage gpG-like protein
MQFEIKLEGMDKLDRKLRRLSSQLMDWQDAFRTIGAAFADFYGNVPFASRGSIYGAPWPDLNPRYKTWKADNYPGRPILIREGDLSQGFDFTSTTNEVRLFNRVDYFEKHQKGIGVPQRIMMALNEERKDAAVDILKDDLAQKMRAA